MKIKDVDPWEIKEVELKPDDDSYLVCAEDTEPLMMPDNVRGKCVKCGKTLQHRPWVPKTQKPICYGCIQGVINEEEAKGNTPELSVTPRAKREARGVIAKDEKLN